MILLILAMPWAAASDSSGRSNHDGAEKVKISTQKQVDLNQVEIEVEFENLTGYITYDYEINITRVDPNWAHESFSDSFDTGEDDDEYTVTEYWTPDQEGPYTVHTTLSQYGTVIATGTDTFGWGDVANNSAPASVTITANPNQDYYDVAGNEEAQKEVVFKFEMGNRETGAAYVMMLYLFRMNESGNPDEDVELVGSGTTTEVVYRNMSALEYAVWAAAPSDAVWTNDTDYRLKVELFLIGHQPDGPVAASDEMTFTVGVPPPEPVDLLDLEFNCIFGDDDGDDGWHMVLEEGDSGQARGTDLNCAIYNPNVVTVVGTVNISATGVPDGAGIDSNLNDYSIEADSSHPGLLSFDCGGGNCAATDGTVTIKIDFYEENHTYWNQGTVTHTIDFEIEENQTVITPEPIFGCKDEFAKNFNPDATDDDGSCTYDQLRVVLTANQTTGDVSLSVTFYANISQGRTPYQISWDFDDGTFAENLTSIDHTFYTAGVYNVLLQVTDIDGDMLERGIQIIATEPPVIGNLTGFISHSGQLDPINKDMVASIEFYGTANGGEGPYTFTWKFGDDTGGSGATILHEYATGGEFTVELIIEDSAGRTLQLEEAITIVKESDEGGGITPPLEEVDGGEGNFDIYATSTGAIGLLLMFGLFGRKRRESFLEAERRVSQGEGSMWDKY
ncbi:MAG: PKD domain-containing protein [Candidatus Poseidoniales archaeon]|nr:PKD domain-containing protein [Candidatus Poseidoniales archaeon]